MIYFTYVRGTRFPTEKYDEEGTVLLEERPFDVNTICAESKEDHTLTLAFTMEDPAFIDWLESLQQEERDNITIVTENEANLFAIRFEKDNTVPTTTAKELYNTKVKNEVRSKIRNSIGDDKDRIADAWKAIDILIMGLVRLYEVQDQAVKDAYSYQDLCEYILQNKDAGVFEIRTDIEFSSGEMQNLIDTLFEREKKIKKNIEDYKAKRIGSDYYPYS